MLHTPNDFENKLDCPFASFSSPTGGISVVISVAYDKE